MSVSVSTSQLDHYNALLSQLEPQQIIQWAVLTFPNLFQTTAFGLTGLVSTDMISKLDQSRDAHAIDLIFLDTLYHFDETLELVDRVQKKYPSAKIHRFRPEGFETRDEFEKVYGNTLFDTNDDLYDYLVKVEPSQRAYKELDVVAVLTGRRKSQGDARDALKIVEIEAETNLIKINPLANWSFSQVKEYIDLNDVPYNSLLDRGYRSVGDFHSTVPVKEGENERAGRWKGKQKTECGIHQQKRFAQFSGVNVKAV
ncbi:Phosphoadenosine phosphosulfate reductase [Yarrowia sp. C11]|nr:Phosphoadenosine phosphosulfate reductase [Yarrowia sp. E02]KAG5373013.1 Phosphoadenosine phosphosulfate reductase [Yarrowia sp. C11]